MSGYDPTHRFVSTDGVTCNRCGGWPNDPAHPDAAAARRAAPRPQIDVELRQAVRMILRGFDEGVFVRSTSGDTDPAWAIKVFPFLRALAIAQESLGACCLGEDCPLHGGPNHEGQR